MLVGMLLILPSFAGDAKDDLWLAARKGDIPTLEALLAKGCDVNAKTKFGATALWYACYKGHVDAAKMLLRHHADPNVVDAAWGETPLSLAVGNEKLDLVKALLAAGADGGDATLLFAAGAKQLALLRTILESAKAKPETLNIALQIVPDNDQPTIAALKNAGARDGAAAPSPGLPKLAEYAGGYESHNGAKYRLEVRAGWLLGGPAGPAVIVFRPLGDDRFGAIGLPKMNLQFEREAAKIIRFNLDNGTIHSLWEKADSRPVEPVGTVEQNAGAVSAPRNWPSFRGQNASGVADGQNPPAAWDVEKGTNILWKTPIPGLGHSSPIIWGHRIFLTTAISENPKSEFRPGLYGAGESAKDVSKHTWKLYCLDKRTGKVVWERTATEGVPKIKRHPKASHANATPATDGKNVVAYFGSEGLYCYDFDGNLRWKQDLGIIDVGAFGDPDNQWGYATSPILYRDLVIMQCDRHKDSFIAAYALDTGKRVWLTARDELPSWGTPTVCPGPAGPELVANGTGFIRGYDPLTGDELWRLGGNSEITVPTPVTGQGLVYVTAGYRPVQPVYAIRLGGRGDITLPPRAESGEHVAWAKRKGGTYMPTPVLYSNYLYTCSNNGTVTCYEALTGKQVYQKRVGGQSGYSASPVAADGKLYFAGEDGAVRIVKAGPNFELLAVNRMGDPCMATPAISDGMVFIRTQHDLYGIGKPSVAQAPADR
jgi:outer membrane protein assembly factor BamB